MAKKFLNMMLSASQQQQKLVPLTLTAIEGGATVTFNVGTGTDIEALYYRTTDTAGWTPYV